MWRKCDFQFFSTHQSFYVNPSLHCHLSPTGHINIGLKIAIRRISHDLVYLQSLCQRWCLLPNELVGRKQKHPQPKLNRTAVGTYVITSSTGESASSMSFPGSGPTAASATRPRIPFRVQIQYAFYSAYRLPLRTIETLRLLLECFAFNGRITLILHNHHKTTNSLRHLLFALHVARIAFLILLIQCQGYTVSFQLLSPFRSHSDAIITMVVPSSLRAGHHTYACCSNTL